MAKTSLSRLNNQFTREVVQASTTVGWPFLSADFSRKLTMKQVDMPSGEEGLKNLRCMSSGRFTFTRLKLTGIKMRCALSGPSPRGRQPMTSSHDAGRGYMWVDLNDRSLENAPTYGMNSTTAPSLTGLGMCEHGLEQCIHRSQPLLKSICDVSYDGPAPIPDDSDHH